MINGEFKVDTEAGVVVFCQYAHGVKYVSKSKSGPDDEFNVGVGQLIAMKRNEIKIRKADIEEMKYISYYMGTLRCGSGDSVRRKLYTNFKQITDEKINASQNHIKELKRDLDALYNGTYSQLPPEVKTGEKVYAVVDGSIKLVENKYF